VEKTIFGYSPFGPGQNSRFLARYLRTFARALTYASALAIKVVLIDGLGLANLMIDHGVGVTTESVYDIKHINFDYFDLS
jgi:restriction endonuclease Mrr